MVTCNYHGINFHVYFLVYLKNICFHAKEESKLLEFEKCSNDHKNY